MHTSSNFSTQPPRSRVRSGVINPVLARKILRVLRDIAKGSRKRGDQRLLAELEVKFADFPEHDAYVTLAQRKHSGEGGDVEVDQDAAVSQGSDGAYVQAWTFISKEELSLKS